MQNSFVATIKAILIFTTLLVFLIILAVLNIRKSRYRMPAFTFGCKLILIFANIRVKVYGKVSPAAPVLYASNHMSYLDIPIFASLIGKPYISKVEVKSWPLFGNIATLIDTLYIDRLAQKTPENIKVIREKLHQENGLIMFAEGTTSDGNRVLPFKSSFFAIAEQEFSANALNIQPVAICYTKINNISMGTLYRPYVAWYGDMALIPHLWQLLRFWSVQAEVVFFPSVASTSFASRKELANYCQQKIANAVELVLTNRKEELVKEVVSN